MLYGKIGVTILYNFALRKVYFRGRLSASPKNRGRSKKTQERTALKNWGGSLAMGSYIQRGSDPPHPPGGYKVHSRPRHLQEKGANSELVRQALFFSLFGPM